MYTVKQLADLAGVTVRTLDHYDSIGLLKPSSIGPNGYRYYGEDGLYRLQQILLYRQLEVPLEEIKRIVNRPGFDVLAALDAHRTALQAEAERIEMLIRTIDLTAQHLKGEVNMSDHQLFRGFSEEEQEKMAAEAQQQWGESVRTSNARWKHYAPEKKQRIMDEGNALYKELISAMSEDPSSPTVQAIVKRWHDHMQYFWSPSDEQLIALANGYNDDPRFLANFEAMKPGLAVFMREAVEVYVNRRG